jgi:hypothetical protein
MLGVQIISQEIFMLLFNMDCRVKPGNDALKIFNVEREAPP